MASTLASSSGDGGAPEHTETEWEGEVCFENVGLAGAAVRGKKWFGTHRVRRLTQFTKQPA